MSSSLISVGSVGASAVAGAGASPAGGSAPKTLMDVFASLLGNTSGEAGAETTQSSTSTINGLELGDIAREIIASLLEGKPAEVATEAPAEGEGTELPGLADLLAKIEAALDAGETVDPELLKKLGESIDALAAIIGSPAEVTATVSADLPLEIAAAGKATPEGDPVPEQPVLKGLADKLQDLAGKLGDADTDLATKLEALADKLTALKTTVADLIEDAPELKAIIEALVQPKAEAKASVTGPALAAPALRLPAEASLSPKKEEPQTPASPPSADDAETPADTDVADAPRPLVKVEAKAEQPVVAGAPEKRDAPAAPPAPSQPPAPADTMVVTTLAPTATGSQQAVHGEVRAIHTAYQQPSPINLPQMAFEIARQVQQGVSKFQIRLDPPELGRVDVNLDMDRSGQVNAKLIVERSETLDLLQRDHRALERALAQAGLDTSKTNLEFSLRQNPFAGQDGKGQGQPGASPFASDLRAPMLAEAEPQAVTVYRGTASPGGVNIFV